MSADLYGQIEELMLELEDDSSANHVVIPGSFRPPHLGHLQMVQEYSNMVGNGGQVTILVSSPLKNSRYLGESVISSKSSKALWEMLLEDSGLDNVVVEVSNMPTPLLALKEFIGDNGSLEPGSRFIIGASQKNGDFKNFGGLQDHIKSGVELMEADAFLPSVNEAGSPFSASEIRKSLLEGENVDEFFGEGKTPIVRQILGLQEMSSGTGGSVQGAQGSAKTDDENRNESKQRPYNELYLYKEVLKRLAKKGIIK